MLDVSILWNAEVVHVSTVLVSCHYNGVEDEVCDGLPFWSRQRTGLDWNPENFSTPTHPKFSVFLLGVLS